MINVYMADLQHVQNMRKLEMNLEVIAKLRTNLKLNAIDKSGNALIPKQDYHDSELHMMRFEANYKTIKFDSIATAF